MSETVLISGGTGLVGKKLCLQLAEKGYDLRVLSRSKRDLPYAETFQWDVAAETMDEAALDGVSHVIHLAGAGIADKPWTAKRKKEIVNSRTKSAQLLLKSIERKKERPLSFISASAVGYYGDSKDKLFVEDDYASSCFLGKTCELWESSSRNSESLGLRRVILRIGIVLDKDGGALVKMAAPAKFGIGAYFGDGKQWYSWIHIDDLVNMFTTAVENPRMQGVYNAVAPNPVSNKDLMRELASALNRPFIPAPAPAFVLRTVMGEMSNILLYSTKVSAEKIVESGFEFQYPEIGEALNHIYSK